ncbi:MAG: hypothetical protein DRJ67_11980 [Thermoprotei archaeon]|nr:MAG: hypothetical protein DRJ67_11980 [Thermoprotei archaeon]
MRALKLLAAALGVAYGMITLALSASPLYLVRGPVWGAVSLVTYRLWAFGSPFYSPALDTASVLSLSVLLSATLNIAASAWLMIEGGDEAVRAEAHAGAALSSLVSIGVLRGLKRLIGGELAGIAGSFDHVTSAGHVILGRVIVEEFPPASVFFGSAYLILAAALVAVSLAHLVQVYAGLRAH